jgi:hypothetical protein
MRVMSSTEIMVIEPIDTTNEGPQVPKGEKGWQSVHLRQGSMDGACGLYSLMGRHAPCIFPLSPLHPPKGEFPTTRPGRGKGHASS